MPASSSDWDGIWTDDELERDRQIALQRFVDDRLDEAAEPYHKCFIELRPKVERLFAKSRDLLLLDGEVFVREPHLIEPARFITGPPISRDDLNNLVGGNPFKKSIEASVASTTAHLLSRAADPFRFPWLDQDRGPTAAEKEMAIRWTTGLWCVQMVRTRRRMRSSTRQQDYVRDRIEVVGWTFYAIRNIDALEDLPPGNFSDESILAGSKCDIPIRLHDRRLLAIECKVSNSAVNSIKRLIHEVGNKAAKWHRAFGTRIIPAAVLSGVFALRNLQSAQESGIRIFWEHDLDFLINFIGDQQRDC